MSSFLSLPLDICWDGSDFSNPKKVAVVAGRFPEVPILMGHCGGSPTGHEKPAQVAKAHRNTFLEVCGSEYSGIPICLFMTHGFNWGGWFV